MSKYFGRVYKLVLTPPGGKAITFSVGESTTPLDIKFDVKYARGQIAREGTVSVLGLSTKTIQQFLALTGMVRGQAMSKLAKVKLMAGYLSAAGMVPIIDGYAWRASVTSPPNMWLKISVSECNVNGGPSIQPNIIGTLTLKQWAITLMNMFSTVEGVPISVVDRTKDSVLDKLDSENQVIKLSFTSEGVTLRQAITELNRNASKDIFFILRSSGNGNSMNLEAVDRSPYKAYDKTIVVDKNHGLLSVSGLDAINGSITTFLDGSVDDNFSHLKLTSELNPQANGTYYITERHHIGHYQGAEWYTQYTCSAKKS